jgi:hypothetical protein
MNKKNTTMKKLLFLLLLLSISSYGQAPFPEGIQLPNNTNDPTATKVNVQSNDGDINFIAKSDLVDVLEYASAINLPVTGVAGKIYCTKDNNKIYRWNGTFYQELAVTDISGKVDKVAGKSLLSDTEISRLLGIATGATANDTDVNLKNRSNHTGTQAISTVTSLQPALDGKVDKVAGKSLLSDTEITRLVTLSNYTHPANHPPSIISQDPSNRFVTDAEKAAWNAKQSALGFTAENAANKNVVNGYAGLGADGKLISSQLPSITISDTFVTASQAAMLAVTAETGDVAVRTDLNKSFILKGVNPSVLADWQELLTPTSTVTTVFGRNGAVVAQTNDYTADQITETATRKFQTATQNTNNNATSPIQGQINLKEPAFTKNTAFNLNFGTAAGTVAQGNDSRILNGQTAFGWGNHASAGYALLTGSNINQSSFRTSLGLGSNAYSSTAYLPINGGYGGDVNQNDLNFAGKLFAASNSANSYGTFLSFGGGIYTTQINSDPNRNGVSYIRVNGDGGGIGDWRKLWHSGNFNPTSYLLLTGGTLEGNIYVRGTENGSIGLENVGTTINSVLRRLRTSWYGDVFDYDVYRGGGAAITKATWSYNGNNKMEITTDGNFYVTGNATSTGFFNSSDRSLKNIIRRDGEVAYFKWKDKRDNKTHIGYIAQEVRKKYPDQVQKGEDSMLSVNYVEILVEKIRVLEKRIQKLEKKCKK